MKGRILKMAASIVSTVASVSARPLCLFLFHQPKIPAQLLK